VERHSQGNLVVIKIQEESKMDHKAQWRYSSNKLCNIFLLR